VQRISVQSEAAACGLVVVTGFITGGVAHWNEHVVGVVTSCKEDAHDCFVAGAGIARSAGRCHQSHLGQGIHQPGNPERCTGRLPQEITPRAKIFFLMLFHILNF